MLRKISYLLITILFTLFSIQALHGEAGIQLRLKEKAYVQPGSLILKDIADVEGTNTGWIKTIGNMNIPNAPEFGKVKTFSRHQILTMIEKTFDNMPEIKLSGAEIVQIRIQGRSAKPQIIISVLKIFLTETTSWRDQEIEVTSINNLEKIELPPDECTLKISSKSPIIGKGKILVPIDATCNGKVFSSFWVNASIRIRAQILTAAQKIPYKRVIRPEDIEKVEVEIDNPKDIFYRNPETILGKVSNKNFYPGDPLTRNAFSNPYLINSGDLVNLRLEKNGILLTCQVRAEQNGRLGQVIRVRNVEYSRVFKAEVTGRSEVIMP